jgi:hypothetical protein
MPFFHICSYLNIQIYLFFNWSIFSEPIEFFHLQKVKMAKRKFQPAEPGEKRQKSKRSYNEEEEEEEKEELIKVSHARY